MRILKNATLVTKISVVLTSLLSIVFAGLIIYTVISTSSSISIVVKDEIQTLSKLNGNQVQYIIDTATNTAKDMESYLIRAFTTFKESTNIVQTYLSNIYNIGVSEAASDIEKYISETARNVAATNPEIRGIGTMFEPYKFDKRIESYSFYVQENIGEAAITPLGKYEDYADQLYYQMAMQSKTIIVTPPYLFDGVNVVSVSVPIIYSGEFLGVIVVDVNVDNFSKLDSKNEKYPSLFAAVLNNDNLIIYNSLNTAESVGKDSLTMINSENEKSQIKSMQKEAQPFILETTRENGSKLVRTYFPINAGNQTWWSLTALSSSDMNKAVLNSAIWLTAISIIALLVIILAIIIASKQLLKPIGNLVEAARHISNGNFDLNLKSTSNDEIGVLTSAFNNTAITLSSIIKDISVVLNSISNKNFDVHTSVSYVGDLREIETSINNIIGSLNDVMGNIETSAEQVSSGSEQVSSGAQALSQGATEQASSVQELSATISEMSQQVRKNAENAEMASKQSVNSRMLVEKSNTQMQEMIIAINEITDSSTKISKIIKTIEDIAFQTNILALNAAVEAARAGVAGKGFAVVADEVRNLASKSAKAANETTALIENSIKAVQRGTKIASETANSLLDVVKVVTDVTGTVNSISHASGEQATSINHIAMGIEQISSVVQTNSATAEQSAAASEELSAQANMLKTLVSQFSLKDSHITSLNYTEENNSFNDDDDGKY